jgi:hypothetical protein
LEKTEGSLAHVVDGVESGRVVLSECVLVAIEGSLVPFECLAILPLVGENRAHVVDGVREWKGGPFRVCSHVAIEGSLVPFECLAILPLVGENHAHVLDGAESGRVVLSECVLVAIEGSLVPFECLAILPLVGENQPMLWMVLRVEGWSFPSVFS